MAIDPKVKMKVEAELRLGKTSKELSEKYSLPYITVQSWRKKAEAERADMDIDALVQTDEITLHTMAEEIKDRPMPPIEQKKAMETIKGVVGLKRIDEKTRELSMKILEGVEDNLDLESMGDGVIPLKTLREASSIVSTLHAALFSKNTTNVNVMNNNNISGEKRELFKSSMRS